jgi:hypothetical protein
MSPFWSCSGTELHVSRICVELTASADTLTGAAEGTTKKQKQKQKPRSVWTFKNKGLIFTQIVELSLKQQCVLSIFAGVRLNLQENNSHANLFHRTTNSINPGHRELNFT